MTTETHLISSIGIDLGSYSTKIAAAKRGGIQILTNQANFRQTPSIVGYGQGERKIGQAGNIKLKSNFKDSIVAPTRFLGLHNSANSKSPLIKIQGKFCPAKFDFSNQKQDLVFSVKYQGQNKQLTPEEVTAAYLNKIKSIINNNNLNAKQIIIAVPAYFTQGQKQALMTAAQIADINVNQIVNDSAAVAMQYGITRKSEFDQPRNVLFIDFGHSKFSSYLCNFKKDSVQFLDEVHSRNLGCRDIDMEVFQFYRNYFLNKTSLDINESKKGSMKLKQNIEKQRKTLSGNKQHDLNIEYLMEDEDLHYNMKRSEFENISKSVFNEISKKLNEIKQMIIKRRVPVHSIELLGGGTRIPFFLQLVSKIFGIQPSRTLNSSQAVAKGCAIIAASKSPIFRVSKYSIVQKSKYGIIVSWNLARKGHLLGYNSQMYPEKQRRYLYEVGSSLEEKVLKIPTEQPLEILVQYENFIPGGKSKILYLITNPQKKYRESFGTLLKFNFNQNEMLNVIQSSMQQLEEPEYHPHPKRGGRNSFGGGFGQFNNFFGGFGQGFNQSYGGYTPRNQKESPKQKKNLVKYQLQTQMFSPYKKSLQQIDQMKKSQLQMMRKDNDILETYEKKNLLESLIYSSKEKLQDQNYKKHVQNEKALKQYLETLNNEQNWLYQQTDYVPKLVYDMKIKNIEKFMNPLIELKRQYQTYQEQLNSYQEKVNQKIKQANRNLSKIKILESFKEFMYEIEENLSQRKLNEASQKIKQLNKKYNQTLEKLNQKMESQSKSEESSQPEIIEDEKSASPTIGV